MGNTGIYQKTVLQEIIQRKSWWFQIVGSTKVLI